MYVTAYPGNDDCTTVESVGKQVSLPEGTGPNGYQTLGVYANDVCRLDIAVTGKAGLDFVTYKCPTWPTAPAPVAPEPATPAPVTKATPAPVTPSPVTPAPVTTAPITPSPVSKAPITPAPLAIPAPVTPAPITPAPVTPNVNEDWKFVLVNADTNVDLAQLSQTETTIVYDYPHTRFNVRLETAHDNVDVKSVTFSNGQTEGMAPYAYCGDVSRGNYKVCRDLTEGTHTITAIASDSENVPYDPVSTTFEIRLTLTRAPSTAPSAAPSVFPSALLSSLPSTRPTPSPTLSQGPTSTGAPVNAQCEPMVEISCLATVVTDKGNQAVVACENLKPPASLTTCTTPIDTLTMSYRPDATCEGRVNAQKFDLCWDLRTEDGASMPEAVDVECVNTMAFPRRPLPIAPSATGIVAGQAFDVDVPMDQELPYSLECTLSDSITGVVVQRTIIGMGSSLDGPVQLKNTFGSLQIEGCDNVQCLQHVDLEYAVQNDGASDMWIDSLQRKFDGDDQKEEIKHLLTTNPLASGDTDLVRETTVLDLCQGVDLQVHVNLDGSPDNGPPCAQSASYSFRH